MRGHFLSQTRKLNRHYQSGGIKFPPIWEYIGTREDIQVGNILGYATVPLEFVISNAAAGIYRIFPSNFNWSLWKRIVKNYPTDQSIKITLHITASQQIRAEIIYQEISFERSNSTNYLYGDYSTIVSIGTGTSLSTNLTYNIPQIVTNSGLSDIINIGYYEPTLKIYQVAGTSDYVNLDIQMELEQI